MPPASQAVHGISTSQVRRKGRDPSTVLDEFEEALTGADYVVAHNLEFDKAVVQAEAYRQGRDNPFIRIGFGLSSRIVRPPAFLSSLRDGAYGSQGIN